MSSRGLIAQAEAAEVQAERDDFEAVRAPDTACEQVVALERAERDQPRRPGGEDALGGDDRGRRTPPEVALEYVPVEGMDARRIGEHRHDPTKEPRLGMVGVDDVRPECPDQLDETGDGTEVGDRIDRARQRVEAVRGDIQDRQIDLEFVGLDTTMDQQGVPTSTS